MFIEDNLSQLSFFNDLLLYLLCGSVTLFFNSDLFIYGLTNLALEKESNIKKFTDKWMKKNGYYCKFLIIKT